MRIDEFLEARIAEDEAAAIGSDFQDGVRWRYDAARSCVWDGTGTAAANSVRPAGNSRTGAHIARHDPARVLAECAAKRSLIEAYGDEHGSMSCLGPLASIYADHPDYDPAWKL